MTPNDLAMIANAAMLANHAHAACGQVRKGTCLPYIIHPYRVSLLVTEVGGDATQIAAAWAHDVLEDCSEFREEARTALPPAVYDLVCQLTKREIAPGKRVKGEAFMAELRAMSPAAKLVKLCDRLDNLREAPTSNEPDWVRNYGTESIAVLDALAVNPAPGASAARLVALIREQIELNRQWADAAECVGHESPSAQPVFAP
jgi:(p)ppGpp synthase/HD superfamily hydrolase